MLMEDVADPLFSVQDTEKKALSSALLNLSDYGVIDRLTRDVANDCINEEVARRIYETTIET